MLPKVTKLPTCVAPAEENKNRKDSTYSCKVLAASPKPLTTASPALNSRCSDWNSAIFDGSWVKKPKAPVESVAA